MIERVKGSANLSPVNRRARVGHQRGERRFPPRGASPTGVFLPLLP